MKIKFFIKHTYNTVKSFNNERGFIMAIVLLLALVMVLAVTMVHYSSQTEMKIVRNEGLHAQNFYTAEGAIASTINNRDLWMTEDFKTARINEYRLLAVANTGEVVAIPTPNASATFSDPAAVRVATVGIRPLTNLSGQTVEKIPELTALHEDANAMDYITPDAGTVPGTSANSPLRTLKYAVTARDDLRANSKDSAEGNAVIQVGIQDVTVIDTSPPLIPR